MKYVLKLDTVTKAKDFVSIVRKYEFNVSVESDHYIIDGKSILGLLSLDLSNELNVYVKNGTIGELEKFYSEISKYEA